MVDFVPASTIASIMSDEENVLIVWFDRDGNQTSATERIMTGWELEKFEKAPPEGEGAYVEISTQTALELVEKFGFEKWTPKYAIVMQDGMDADVIGRGMLFPSKLLFWNIFSWDGNSMRREWGVEVGDIVLYRSHLMVVTHITIAKYAGFSCRLTAPKVRGGGYMPPDETFVLRSEIAPVERNGITFPKFDGVYKKCSKCLAWIQTHNDHKLVHKCPWTCAIGDCTNDYTHVSRWKRSVKHCAQHAAEAVRSVSKDGRFFFPDKVRTEQRRRRPVR